jgi:hypothetical protein
MIKILLDFDSMLYLAIYRCVSISEIKNFLKESPKEITREAIIQVALSRLENQVLNILRAIEDTGIDADFQDVEYYLTCCKNNFRKEIEPSYKANRKPNKWVNELRNRAIELYDARISDFLEADDLIANRCRELGVHERLIVSTDKDLRQLEGLHYIYGRYNGDRLIFIDKRQGVENLCKILLIGDMSDNIRGVKGIGEVKANKMLKDKSVIEMLKETIISYNDKKTLKKNFKLIKL